MPQLVSRETDHHPAGLARPNPARFHIIVAFNGLGQACADHLIRGSAVYIEGRLQIRTYEDNAGHERTSVEVVASKIRFLGNGSNNGDEKRPIPGQPKTRKAQPSAPQDDFDQAVNSDDCPF